MELLYCDIMFHIMNDNSIVVISFANAIQVYVFIY